MNRSHQHCLYMVLVMSGALYGTGIYIALNMMLFGGIFRHWFYDFILEYIPCLVTALTQLFTIITVFTERKQFLMVSFAATIGLIFWWTVVLFFYSLLDYYFYLRFYAFRALFFIALSTASAGFHIMPAFVSDVPKE